MAEFSWIGEEYAGNRIAGRTADAHEDDVAGVEDAAVGAAGTLIANVCSTIGL